MFCEQCEQTASGNGCHQWGACGKSPEVNSIHDLLVYCVRGLAAVAQKAREFNISTHQADVFICEALFATMTNVNFHGKRLTDYIKKCLEIREDLKAKIAQSTVIAWSAIANYQPDFNESLAEQGQNAELHFLSQANNIDIFSLKLTTLYGVKGLASYTFHAYEMGQEDDGVYAFIEEALTNNVLKLLSETYNLKPITTPDQDLAACLNK